MFVSQVAALGCEADFNTRVAVGGPDTFNFGEVIALAGEAAGVPDVQLKTIPLWLARALMAVRERIEL